MRFSIIFIIILITGCSSLGQQRPLNAPKANAKIGILFVGEKYPKHTHIGTTIFQNFTIENASETDYSVEMINVVKKLMSNKNYSFVEVNGAHLSQKDQVEPFSFFSGKPKEDVNKLLEDTRKKYELDYLFILHPYRGEAFVNSSAYVHGFGLYTQCRFDSCTAEALNYHDMSIVSYPKFERVNLWNWSYYSRRPVEGINFGDDLKDIDEEIINNAANIFLRHFEDLTREKLIWSRFIEGNLEESTK